MTRDPGCLALIELGVDDLRALVARVIGGARIESVERVEGGLVNMIYRVVPAVGGPIGVRIYATGVAAFEKERCILTSAPTPFPAPRVLAAVADCVEFRHPYIVYRWVDGITLNEHRRASPPAALLELAAPLGHLAATVAGCRVDCGLPVRRAADAIARADDELRDGAARGRLGVPLADELRARLAAVAPRLEDADRSSGLTHGDFGGRNIVVGRTADGTWLVSGLLDWEGAFVGAALWDVGSLFRYADRYASSFRDHFETGYCGAGGALPDGWCLTARLLDATRLVEILSGDRDLPEVYAECRGLVETLVWETRT